MTATSRKSIINVVVELGRGGEATSCILRRTESGLHRNAYALDLSPACVRDAAKGTRELTAKGSVRADVQDLLEPLKAVANNVAEGEISCLIHHPDTPQNDADSIMSPCTGSVLCRRAMAQAMRGDAVCQIGTDA